MRRNFCDLVERSLMTNGAARADKSCYDLHWCFHMLKLTLAFDFCYSILSFPCVHWSISGFMWTDKKL